MKDLSQQVPFVLFHHINHFTRIKYCAERNSFSAPQERFFCLQLSRATSIAVEIGRTAVELS